MLFYSDIYFSIEVVIFKYFELLLTGYFHSLDTNSEGIYILMFYLKLFSDRY